MEKSFEAGDKFERDGHFYMLAWNGDGNMILVNMKDGCVWNGSHKTNGRLSETEFMAHFGKFNYCELDWLKPKSIEKEQWFYESVAVEECGLNFALTQLIKGLGEKE